MFDDTIEREQFLSEYGIDNSRFRESQLSWKVISDIVEDYRSQENEHKDIAAKIASELQGCPYVHSLGYRIKDPYHLAEKIIRKNAQCISKGFSLSVDNYKEHITDLIGVRIMLLFKADWEIVHNHIIELYGDMLNEKPFVYAKAGDDLSLFEGKININTERDYRSAHYVVKTEIGSCAEIQVRTLAEEAWGEIDHKLRYPYNLYNPMLNNYMSLVSRLTGMIDEMGTFVNDYISVFNRANRNNVLTDNKVYNYILSELESNPDKEMVSRIKEKIEAASDYKKMESMTDLLSDIFKTWSE